jgi:diguanylate cyclase (GGDEF)-like protein
LSLRTIINGTRFRLIAVGLLATVPVIATQFLDAGSVERAMVRDLRDDTVDKTHQATSEVIGIATEAVSFIQLIGRLPEVTVDQPLLCSETLKPMTAQRPWAKSFLIADPSGTVACATDDRAVGLGIADREYFQLAVETRRSVIGDIIVSRLDRLPSLPIAYPQFGFNGNLKQVVIATMKMDWLVTQALHGHASEGARAVFIDDDGKVAGAYTAEGEHVAGTEFGRKFEAAWHGVGRDDPSATFDVADEDGVSRVYAARPIPRTHSWFAVGLSRAAAAAATKERTDRAFVMAAIAAATIFLLAWIAGEFLLMRPLKAFVDAADDLNAGKLDARVHLSLASTQFDAMAVAFNAMAAKLEKLALEDSLTGVANRRGFDKAVGRIWRAAAQGRVSIALGLIDVDKFKNFNDRYGHVAGDMVLRQVGRVMKGHARRGDDLVARYGGEEFALILWGNSAAEARQHCEELRKAVLALGIRHDDAPDGLVSVSVGVATVVPAPDGDPQELIARADRALYLAKSRGRDRVVVAPDGPEELRPTLVA